MVNNKLQIGFFTFLLCGAAALAFFVLKPYLGAIFIALVLRVSFGPAHKQVLRFLGNRENVASFISVLLIVIFIVAPVFAIGTYLFDDASRFYTKISSGTVDFSLLEKAIEPVQKVIYGFVPDYSFDPGSYARQAVEYVLSNMGSIFSSAVGLIFDFVLMLFALFYLFRDGSRFRKNIIILSPLSNNFDESILLKLNGAVGAVVRGSLLTALIQGILASVGLYIFGVPNPVLWGAVAALMALVPNFGTILVMAPAVLFLLWSSSLVSALGLLVWSLAIVGLIDNLLAPHFMAKGMSVHPFLVFLSVLGGFVFFGPVGFIAGPVLISLLFALLDIYPTIVAGTR